MQTFAPAKTKSAAGPRHRSAPATVGPPVHRAPPPWADAALTSLGVLAKLKVSQRDEPAEQEANQIADRIVAMSDSSAATEAPPNAAAPPPSRPPPPGTPDASSGSSASSSAATAAGSTPPLKPVNRYLLAAGLHRSECESCEEESEPMVHTSRDRDAPDETLARLGARVFALRQRGAPLPSEVRTFMEPRFGRDFSGVRIHLGTEPEALSQSLHARAFTVGEHIAFGPGQYRPDTETGRKLIAHELTHVVQQRGGQPAAKQVPAVRPEKPKVQRGVISWLGDRASDVGGAVSDAAHDVGHAVSSAASAVGGALADLAWAAVRELAPSLEPILREGPFNWLKRQVGNAFHSLISAVTSLLPPGVVQVLNTVFGGLMTRASQIVGALASGDCGPLFQALRDLKDFISQVAGEVWDKLVDFLHPIGDFFARLWNGYGAPAVQWLREFAGEVWQVISDLGHDIWEWIQPLRNGVRRIWNWVKEKLFGPDDDSSGESSGGIIHWITEKAGEAWDWVKEQTRPVWQPISRALATVRSLIPPAFIRRLGESFQHLGAQLNQAGSNLGDDGDDVAQNRAALASVLPSVQQVLAAARGAIVSAKTWVLETMGSMASQFSNFLSELRNSSIFSPVAGALAWLEGVGNDLNSWAQDKVGGLFDFVIRAFDYVSPFIEKMVELVRQVIAVMADILRLPTLILGSIWNLIPACIRNPIRDFFINQILRRIPVFSFLLDLPDLWARVEAVALRILRQVFVDGNLAGAAWTFFRNMLRLIGIPPELVVSILAKAASALGDILTNPIRFLTTLLSGVVHGFGQFFDHIGTHLLNGITGWLFGAMQGAGITPPHEFSLRSILGIVLQILDISVDRIFARLARRVSPEIVARLRQAVNIATGVWEWVAVLINEGPGGLWRLVQDRLSNLWSTVISTAISWITQRVIAAGIRWLAGFLDISGIMPVINTLIAVYRAIQSAVAYIRQILEVVNTALDGIGAMARGDPGPAANFVERALAGIVPVAIGFVANQVGLGDISARIREVIEGVRAMVDQAIDWLIDRALRAGRAFLDMLRRGVTAVRGGVAALRQWWRSRRTFRTDSGEEHSLYFTGSGGSARLMIASDPQPYQTFIAGVDVPASKRADKQEALRIAGELDTAVRAAAAPAAGSGAAATGGGAVAVDPSTQINQLLADLASVTARFIPANRNRSSVPVFGPRVGGFGSSVRESVLGPDRLETGSTPSVEDNPHWQALRARRQGGRSYFVRGHLLNHHLGGPGNTWDNLTPMFQDDNGAFERGFEAPVKDAVRGGRAVNFIVTASYGRSPNPNMATLRRGGVRDQAVARIMEAEQFVPTGVTASAKFTDQPSQSPVSPDPKPFPFTFPTTQDAYDLEGAPRENRWLSDMNAEQIQSDFGVTATQASAIAAALHSSPAPRTWEALRDAYHAVDGRLALGALDGIQNSERFNVRLFSR